MIKNLDLDYFLLNIIKHDKHQTWENGDYEGNIDHNRDDKNGVMVLESDH